MEAILVDTGAVPSVSARPAEQRAHPRLRASELRGLKAARVKYGAEVDIVDLSAGGVLFDTSDALTVNSPVVIELSTHTGTMLVPARVLRCHVLVTSGPTVRYESACAFKRPIALDDLIGAPRTATPRMELSSAPVTAAAVAAWQKVAAHFRDGRQIDGFTNDFHPSKPYMNLSPTRSAFDARFVKVTQLEALFFAREASEDSRRDAAAVTHGRKIEVTLGHGGVIVGTTLNYRHDGIGFFIHPADAQSAHQRVFVTSDAIRHFRFI